MQISDPIADLLTRIRNAGKAHIRKITLPSSKIKANVVRVLKEEGFVEDFRIIEKPVQNELEVTLRFYQGQPSFRSIQRVSRPGIRRYTNVADMPRVKSGLGIAILSTPQGILSDGEARKRNVGGEILCNVW